MTQKWVVFIVFVWVIGTIFGLFLEAGTIADPQASKLAQLTGVGIAHSEESWGFMEMAAAPTNYVRTLWEVGTWQFAFLDSAAGSYFKWIVLASPIAGTVWGLLLAFLGMFSKVLS